MYLAFILGLVVWRLLAVASLALAFCLWLNEHKQCMNGG